MQAAASLAAARAGQRGPVTLGGLAQHLPKAVNIPWWKIGRIGGATAGMAFSSYAADSTTIHWHVEPFLAGVLEAAQGGGEKGSDESNAQPVVGPQTASGSPDPNDPCKGFNPPELPPSTIVNENGVTIVHYYFSGDHGPDHMHVIEGGKTITRIGPNGHPIAGDPDLTSKSRRVVENNLSQVGSAGDKIGRWLQWNEKCGQ